MASSRDSGVHQAESKDWSLLTVAAMLIAFGVVFSGQIIPSWHELQAVEKRRAELKQQLASAESRNESLRDEIDALQDPYYVAAVLLQEYNYQRVEETPRTGN